MSSALFALDQFLNENVEIVIIGTSSDRDAILTEIYNLYHPLKLVAISEPPNDSLPLFKNRTGGETGIAVYICVNSVCKLPVHTLDDLKKQLSELRYH